MASSQWQASAGTFDQNLGLCDAGCTSGGSRGLNCCCPACTEDSTRLGERFYLFAGLDGAKQPQDFGVNATMGGRFAANLGIPISQPLGLGAQIGTAINYADNAVQVFERIEGTSERFQNYTTVGLFQRSPSGIRWGATYDFLWQDYFDDFYLGQWRGLLGYAVSPCDEFGTWFTISDQSDHGTFGAIPVHLDPITQGNFYWRHIWASSAETWIWLGVAEGHGEVNVALGDLEPVDECLTFGAEIHAPLNDRLAIYGQSNFITPVDTGTVDAFLGIVFYPGGGAKQGRRRPFMPLLPVASNTTFAVDLAR